VLKVPALAVIIDCCRLLSKEAGSGAAILAILLRRSASPRAYVWKELTAETAESLKRSVI
jgi:hypothetical protein